MAKIKSYTDIEQSKKLAEFLPLESADMCYKCLGEDPYDIVMCPYTDWKEEYKGLLISGDANVFPCWSLACLLGVLPIVDLCTPTLKMKLNHRYYMELCIDYANHKYISTNDYDNPVDACVAMIGRLHELKML